MKCDFCNKDIPEGGPFKEGVTVGTNEEAALCDGPSLGEAVRSRLIATGYVIPFNPSPEQITEISSLGLCAVVYQNLQALQGNMVIVNKRTP
ncbi:MAG: hypothetical protein UX02_C0001G0113 [Candidatus Moranbacteria bacterium GW2011_GWC1_45_18]|nr:MAG: hypothetical protein UT79_C0002G0284 [Candidatus Moranbacteria bacterium GW2011_GWC2_40_12]KKT34123.1 MAG: hypothetical protein UW19_C0001G0018 [Candidatus Moranbacteria bacterium GW2011_GWF2_44_10]KKU00665.1 MAG: hypothetical protein UX02_C0001G0113 [Candidatus Moranbacteria bacterium GW2011_GWC1_45_18]OGI24531.1 MAG: hypothetical protein A2194_00215 [Candidatus Moranbacteria bacterium RIFOXYA1_FULL_44_8]OGI35145.1 MAG: hypothetical protein A2407_04435 [Candidatus Moranbacteria bacteri